MKRFIYLDILAVIFLILGIFLTITAIYDICHGRVLHFNVLWSNPVLIGPSTMFFSYLLFKRNRIVIEIMPRYLWPIGGFGVLFILFFLATFSAKEPFWMFLIIGIGMFSWAIFTASYLCCPRVEEQLSDQEKFDIPNLTPDFSKDPIRSPRDVVLVGLFVVAVLFFVACLLINLFSKH